LARELLASQEGLRSTELVIKLTEVANVCCFKWRRNGRSNKEVTLFFVVCSLALLL